ncbi:MAG: superoxide dismutase [Firmicutes bacterium]|nr:superoxide dismutase [Bacillota bacterium]
MFEQYVLPYSYDALEPYIDALTVETHYSKHHATYTKTFNELAEKAGFSEKSAEYILANLEEVQDEGLRQALKNNGGGYYNHNLYFEEIAPEKGGEPKGVLGEKINETFGSFQDFKENISALAIGRFGSGWAWLNTDKEGNLSLSSSSNQDNPISMGTGLTPIFTIDVWEHAYYLKYKNLRASYVKEFFNIVDWDKVEEKYKNALA